MHEYYDREDQWPNESHCGICGVAMSPTMGLYCSATCADLHDIRQNSSIDYDEFDCV